MFRQQRPSRWVALGDFSEQVTKAYKAHVEVQSASGQPRERPEAPLLKWDLSKSLTYYEARTHGTLPVDWEACQNVHRSKEWADPKGLSALVNIDAPFLNRIAQLCRGAEIRECDSPHCFDRRRAIEECAPRCEWSHFRHWAITAMACQARFSREEMLTRAHTHLVTAVSLCNQILTQYKEASRPLEDVMIGETMHQVDLIGVCEVIYWMMTIQAAIGLGDVFEGKWGPHFLPWEIVDSPAREALETGRRMGICENRLWTLTKVAERKHVDLVGLMEMARGFPSLRHHGHERCDMYRCLFTNVDTSKVKQLHKCENNASCHQIVFPVKLLEDSITSGAGTTWTRYRERIAPANERYVAISHAWIDGTGIGIGNRAGIGIVNRCLSEYFYRILDRLSLTAIWWDTISLPTTDSIRDQAINKMHSNYSSAECTVVHDKYLLNFAWSDDGSPCVALVLSSWFTRGWTALELHESKSVKVLYKGLDPTTPLIKDLDRDILAHDPAFTSRAHWIASSIVRRLRKPVDNVRDLLTILEPRATSKQHDRVSVAALLAHLPGFDSKNSDEKTTRDILTYLKKVGHASVIHNQTAMAESGPFSWSPSAIFEMPVESAGDLMKSNDHGGLLTIDQRGTVTGNWYCRALTSADASRELLSAKNSKDSVDKRIKIALKTWQNCIILREDWKDIGPALLVATVARESGGPSGKDIIDCRFVGAVDEEYLFKEPGASYDSRYIQVTIRLGNEDGRGDTNARKLLGLPDITVETQKEHTTKVEESESEAEDNSEDNVSDDGSQDDGFDDADSIPEDGQEGWIHGRNGPRRPIDIFDKSRP